jgi:hypothetical protein
MLFCPAVEPAAAGREAAREIFQKKSRKLIDFIQ